MTGQTHSPARYHVAQVLSTLGSRLDEILYEHELSRARWHQARPGEIRAQMATGCTAGPGLAAVDPALAQSNAGRPASRTQPIEPDEIQDPYAHG